MTASDLKFRPFLKSSDVRALRAKLPRDAAEYAARADEDNRRKAVEAWLAPRRRNALARK